MIVFPYFVGSGRASRAIEEALAVLAVAYRAQNIGQNNVQNNGQNRSQSTGGAPAVIFEKPKHFKRGESLSRGEQAGLHLLLIANPHGLHSATILEGAAAGFDAIGCEKPSCVNLEEAKALSNVKVPTALFHVYRMMWGPQEMRRRIEAGEFGQIAAIEGRYWQSSSAEAALFNPNAESWKNDTRLGGKYDALLDVGTHWIDAATYLAGSEIKNASVWRSFVNAPAKHRDTHVQVTLDFANSLRAFGTISKTMHGASNHFELNVIGEKQSATWNFLRPDEIAIGRGRDFQTLSMRKSDLGSKHPPHHSMGWTEGYVEILRRLIESVALQKSAPYPTLSENLRMMQTVLSAAPPVSS